MLRKRKKRQESFIDLINENNTITFFTSPFGCYKVDSVDTKLILSLQTWFCRCKAKSVATKLILLLQSWFCHYKPDSIAAKLSLLLQSWLCCYKADSVTTNLILSLPTWVCCYKPESVATKLILLLQSWFYCYKADSVATKLPPVYSDVAAAKCACAAASLLAATTLTVITVSMWQQPDSANDAGYHTPVLSRYDFAALLSQSWRLRINKVLVGCTFLYGLFPHWHISFCVVPDLNMADRSMDYLSDRFIFLQWRWKE